MTKKLFDRSFTPYLCALFFAATQICMLLWLSPQTTWQESWLGLLQWDGGWFRWITELGYVSDFPPTPQNGLVANVAFFPSLPVLAMMLKGLFGISSTAALVLVSNITCYLFWLFFFLLLREWKVGALATLVAAAVIFSYFGSYFIAVAYSESVFMCGLLGMLYFTARYQHTHSAKYIFLAGIFGVLLVGSRLVAIFLAPFAAIFALWSVWKKLLSWKQALPYFAISAISSLGVLLFFAYCQWKWGHWDLYFITQKIGWGGAPDLSLPFDLRIYFDLRKMPWNRLVPAVGSSWSQMASVGFFFLLLFCLVLEIGNRKKVHAANRDAQIHLATRIPLYIGALLMYYVSLSRAGTLAYFGMYRYVLGSLVPIVIALLNFFNCEQKNRERLASPLLWIPLGVSSIISLWVQIQLASLYMHGQWME